MAQGQGGASMHLRAIGEDQAERVIQMATTRLISYEEASPEVRQVFDDIRRTRKTDFINNMWLALANDPELLRRTWAEVKAIMGQESAIDPLTKEMIYIAVS